MPALPGLHHRLRPTPYRLLPSSLSEPFSTKGLLHRLLPSTFFLVHPHLCSRNPYPEAVDSRVALRVPFPTDIQDTSAR